MPIDKIIDFRDKQKKEEARNWIENRKKEFEQKLDNTEKIVIDKFTEKIQKIDINRYAKDIKFTTDVIFDREKVTAQESLKQGIITRFTDVEKIKSGIKRNVLDSDLIGYAKFEPAELGVNFDIREGFSGMSIELANKVSEKINNISFKKLGFMEVGLTEDSIDRNVPIIVEARIKLGTNFGCVLDSEKNINELIFSEGFSVKPNAMSIIDLQGKKYLLVKTNVLKDKDFENSNNITWGRDNYSNYPSLLNSEQVNAMSLYVKSDYKEINPYLRTGQVQGSQSAEVLNKKIDLISSALAVKPIPEEIIVYRRVGQQIFGYGDLQTKIVTFDAPKPYTKEEKIDFQDFVNIWMDKEILDKGFMSTSLSSFDIPAFQNGRFIFRITVPKGTNAAYVTGFDGYEGEQEVLLDKNSILKINRIVPITELMSGNKLITKALIDATLVQK